MSMLMNGAGGAGGLDVLESLLGGSQQQQQQVQQRPHTWYAQSSPSSQQQQQLLQQQTLLQQQQQARLVNNSLNNLTQDLKNYSIRDIEAVLLLENETNWGEPNGGGPSSPYGGMYKQEPSRSEQTLLRANNALTDPALSLQQIQQQQLAQAKYKQALDLQQQQQNDEQKQQQHQLMLLNSEIARLQQHNLQQQQLVAQQQLQQQQREEYLRQANTVAAVTSSGGGYNLQHSLSSPNMMTNYHPNAVNPVNPGGVGHYVNSNQVQPGAANPLQHATSVASFPPPQTQHQQQQVGKLMNGHLEQQHLLQQQQQQQQQPQKPQQQPQQQQQKPQQQAPQPAQQQAPKQQPAQAQQAGPSQQQQGGGGGGKKKGGKGGAGGGDAGVAQVTAQVQQMSVVPTVTGSGGKGLYQIPRRQNKTGGTLGQRIQVDTNHFAISFKNPDLVIFHYDVAIDPDTPVRYMRPVIAETAKKHFPRAAFGYDGKKNLFSKGALPFGVAMTATVTIYDVERMKDKEYKVEIKKAQEINFASIVKYMNTGVDQPQIAIQALDVILREPSCVNPEFVRVGRSYFSKPDPRRLVDLGDGLHLWPGFYQSSRIGWRPFLNVDVAHKGFPVQMHVIDIIKDICRGQLPPELNDYDKVSLKTRVGNLKVIYEIPNQPNSRKIYKVNKIVGSALQERFKPEQGSAEITIADYFSRSKNYRLQFPKYPCFQVGSVANNSRIPCELCTLQGGQVVNKKMNETQTAAMVKAAATGTDIRRQKVMDAMRKINFGNCALLKDFGIGVSDQMERVNARILPPPTVGYDNNRTILVQKGVWRADKFIKPAKITSWAYVNMVHGRPPNWRSLCDNFPGGANSVGMEFPKNPSMVFEDQRENNRNLHNVFAQCKQKGVQVVFVAVPNSGDVYSKVKQVAELEVGVLTQCLREKTLFKMNPATTGNILLKLNAKLNGINHYVKDLKKPRILGKPTIIFGADVTHPSPDETSIPSVAAVTSSYDPAAFKYNMMWNLQDPRVEIIEGLQTFVETQLKFFINANKRKPEHIIFYRDGVSEGQFQQVMGAELTAIKRACQAIESNYNPPVTFLVVQKRHHTRFFPSSPAEGDGSRNNNVRPGTIVDTTITHPTDLDFYLVSHASIQGTARPTKYYRLWDEAKLTDDETEEMTYYLCHLFSRCTRSVSYPAPTYYAHLAAFRGRVYIKNRHINLDNLPRENNTVVAKPDFLQANPMYFV
uniref:Protein argonaute-2 n=1 Tax=Cacopsylla melanoneura TaxID=428564 RepID=A0A8D8VXJ5_9HEMI